MEGVIFTFDLSSRISFQMLQSFIDSAAKIRNTRKFPMIIVGTHGNTSHLSLLMATADEKHEISKDEGRTLARGYSWSSMFYSLFMLTVLT